MASTTMTARRIRALLESSDPIVVLGAVDEVMMHEDRAVIGELLKGAKFTTHVFRHGDSFGDEAKRLEGVGEFRGPEETRHYADLAYLRLLAASDSHLRDVEALAIDTGKSPNAHVLLDDLWWLSEFPNLKRVYLFGRNVTSAQLASLVNVPIQQIGVSSYGEKLTMASHPTVQSIIGHGFGFADDGHWPELRSVSLGYHGPLDAMFGGSPRLTDLRIDTSPTNVITGWGYLARDLVLVRSSSLERATLKGAHFVLGSPRLVELELDGRAAVAGTPNLETLRLGEVQFEMHTELERLIEETGATVEVIDS